MDKFIATISFIGSCIIGGLCGGVLMLGIAKGSIGLIILGLAGAICMAGAMAITGHEFDKYY